MQYPISSGTSLAAVPPSPGRRGGTRARQIGRGLIAVLGLLVVLGLVGTVYESVAEAADVQASPLPGQMIDVGGHSLYINCVGTGTPTVVIDAGWGDSSGAWSSWVQAGRGQDYPGVHVRPGGNGLQRTRSAAAHRRALR